MLVDQRATSHRFAGILVHGIHGHDVTPIQGLRLDMGGPSTRACSPGYHILPLQGSPMGGEHTAAIQGYHLRRAASPACCSPGCRPGWRNTPKTVQIALQGQNRFTQSPPYPAQHGRASPENPIAPFHTHSLSYPVDPSWMRAGGNPQIIPFPFAKAGFKDMVRRVCATHRLCLVSF